VLRLPVVVLLVVVSLAGCTGSTSNGASEGDNQTAIEELHDDVLFSATNCLEGGGHSVHPKFQNYLPKPWLPKDVMDDTGRPPLTSEFFIHPTQPVPQNNNTMGNWHVGVTCQTTSRQGNAVTNHVFGYVGMRVETPPFDEGIPADRHYLITVLASNDAAIREALHHRGFHATGGLGATVIQSNGLFHSLLRTDDHGTYESYFQSIAAGTMPEVFRLWFQKANENGTFSPVSLDLLNEGGSRLRATPYGTFTHMDTNDHAPLPGAGGESPVVAYAGFSCVVKFGPAPNVTMDKAYIHT
jgi:hypothetical protein